MIYWDGLACLNKETKPGKYVEIFRPCAMNPPWVASASWTRVRMRADHADSGSGRGFANLDVQ
jgi:hypothetical protein